MGLETATTISQLVATNPPGTDKKKQGDDHLRLIKSVLQFCFPNATKALYFPTTKAKSADYTVLAADDNCTIVCDTTSAFSLAFPALVAGDAGWSCFVVKTTSDANPVYLVPPSGTINGYTKVRRAIPFNITKVVWTGSAFVASRNSSVPIGARIPFHSNTLPPGYLWPDGATFTAADYVELNTVLGGNTKPDTRGRYGVGKDDMGTGAAGRITTVGGGLDGATLAATGGAQKRTISQANLPNVTLVTDVTVAPHTHRVGIKGIAAGSLQATGGAGFDPTGTDEGPVSDTTVGVTAVTHLGGSGTDLLTLPPSYVQTELLVTE